VPPTAARARLGRISLHTPLRYAIFASGFWACLAGGTQTVASAQTWTRLARDGSPATERAGVEAPGTTKKDEAEAAEPPLEPPSDSRIEGATLPEGPIDASRYRVGPGDQFQLVIWGALDLAIEMIVGPEGTLFIPDVGVVDLRELTLDRARTAVRERVLGVYRDVEVDLFLQGMRSFKVHVAGAVVRPGSYPANGVTRVSDVISLAGGLEPDASSRQIRVRGRDGSEELVDLAGFVLSGRLDHDPFVSDGVVVEVPPRSHSMLVSGAVVNPGIYEPRPGERLSGLLEAIGGLTPSADSSRVTISRFVTASRSEERLFAFRPGPGLDADPDVRDGDRFFFREKTDWHRASEVFVYGEVRRPGRYPIPNDGARLSAVIEMAGGFTPRANLPAAHIIRPRELWTPPSEWFDYRVAALEPDRYGRHAAHEALDSLLVGVDFVALFTAADSTHDVTLRDGDVVQIPQDRGEVRVVGMVRSPGSYPHAAGARAGDYIRAAGGWDGDADRSRPHMAPFAGAPFRRIRSREEVPRGAVIWVPAKQRVEFWQRVRETTTFVVQVASLIVIVDRLTE
jgi:protein involved in polysaccharide export with SLBB domain